MAAADIASTTSVNDGNPHHIALNYNRFSGGSNQLYIGKFRQLVDYI